MGATLPKAVDSTIIERHERKGFRVAACEMNGFRPSMEDAHLVHICSDWAFFGVFDGHGGDQCAKFVAPRLEQELKANGCPADDEAVRKMLFAVDQEFLDTEQDSGTTATMCIVHKSGGKNLLRVINAGDSRVLLGKRDGQIVDGGGTDNGLTTDHKPDNPDEKERIYRCGGTVEITPGNVARVNGDLAVCRGFGDRKYKQTGGPGPEDRPVTVDPEFKRFDCDDADFILLVCDGVSEGDFHNDEVVKLVAEVLKNTGDPGAAARAVCFRAVETNSKDNISCMVVALDGEKDEEKTIEFLPGATDKLSNDSYNKAYVAMAQRADKSLEEAVEMRYDMLTKLLQNPESLTVSQVKAAVGSCEMSEDKPNLEELQEELKQLRQHGDPGEPGSAGRKEYFEKWVSEMAKSNSSDSDMGGFPGGLPLDLLSILQVGKGMGKGKGGYGSSDSDSM